MRLTKTLSIFFLSLVLFSSFKPAPKAALSPKIEYNLDGYVRNVTDVTITEAHIASQVQDLVFNNIDPDHIGAGVLTAESTGDVTFIVTFASPLPQAATATIRSGSNTFTDAIPAGTTVWRYRVYAVGVVGGIGATITY